MRLVENKDIDKKKYDQCIAEAINPKIYAYSWWLDIVHPGWKALIWEDYKAVFPLTIKKYLWSTKIIQPVFTQQLGIFSKQASLYENGLDALDFLQKEFKSGYLQGNDAMLELSDDEEKRSRSNYQLPLSDNQSRDYRSSHKRKIKKAEKEGVELRKISGAEFLKFFKNHNPKFKEDIRPHFLKFTALIDKMSQNNKGGAVGAYLNEELVATVFWGWTNGVLYYLFPALNNTGKNVGANHFLIDQINTIYPEAKIIDFEGSEVPGVQYFIEGFNASLRPYPIFQW